VVAHLTCVGASRADLAAQVDRIHAAGIRNIMALRGDPPRGETEFKPAPDGLAYAADLVALIKERHPDICCGVAGYPETHPEADSLVDDLRHLKTKVEAGADFITTQLFYDNAVYFQFVAAAREAGITVPILPGLMPVSSVAQLERSLAFSRATAPAALRTALAAGSADDARAAGIAWLTEQIEAWWPAGCRASTSISSIKPEPFWIRASPNVSRAGGGFPQEQQHENSRHRRHGPTRLGLP